MLYIEFPSWLTPRVIPGLPVRWYGLMYLIAFAISYSLFLYQVRRHGQSITAHSGDVHNLFFWMIVGLLLGGRLLSVLIYDPSGYYLQRPWRIFWPFENGRFVGIQGMSYHGGLIGAVKKTSSGDLYAAAQRSICSNGATCSLPGIPLGYTFGRLGNFINGELYGRVTTRSWGIVFPNANRVPATEAWARDVAREVGIQIEESGQMLNLPRHPFAACMRPSSRVSFCGCCYGSLSPSGAPSRV